MNSQQTIPATPLAKSSASIESKVFDEPQSVEPQEILGKTVSTPSEAQEIKLGNDKDLLLTIATSSENDLSKEIEGLVLGSKTEEDIKSIVSDSTVDLTGPSYACIDFQQGFIKDDWAKGCEPFQKPHKFLFTGRKPEIDQRTETQVTLGNGNWCRLSGMVTEVGELPSMEQWTSKTCYDTKCNKCIPFEELNPCQKEGFRGFQLAQFGTINGQVVVSLAVLNFDFYYREMNLPFKQDRLYKVTHVANESLELVWEVTKIEDVTEKYASGADGAIPLPESFRKWEAKFGGN